MSGYLETKNLSVGYHGRPLIEDVSLRVQKGKIVTLIGPNGSGKSTILKTVIGQLPELSGTVYLDGETMQSHSRNDIARRMAILMTARVEPELMTCWEVVAAGRYPYTNHFGKLSREDQRIVEDSMARVNALELREQRFTELSDGQKQRVLLARALCAAGDLLVLDEPVTGLDPAAADDLYRTLRYLNRTEGMAVVMVTHDIRSALRDAAAILHAGRDQWFLGTPGEYLASPYGKRFGGDLS